MTCSDTKRKGSKVAMNDEIVYLNKRAILKHPDWIVKLVHPELDLYGPGAYSIKSVAQWLHEYQRKGIPILGSRIYAELKQSGELKYHLGLRDMIAIQKKGVEFYRKHFHGKYVFGWKGLVLWETGDMGVSYLFENEANVVLGSYLLQSHWLGNFVGLRHT